MMRTLALGILSTLFLVAGCGNGTTTDLGTTTGADMTKPAGGDMAMAAGSDAGAGNDLSTASDLSTANDLTMAGGDMAGTGHTVHVGTGGVFTFSPSALTIKVGDTVTWIWDSGGHTVSSGAVPGTADNKFCSPSDMMDCSNNPTSNANATYSHKFAAAGVFPYFCRPHANAGMVGTITVQ